MRAVRLLLATIAVLVLAGCTSVDSGGRPAPIVAGTNGPAPATAKQVAKISAVPAANARDVEVTKPVTITVTGGTLDTVTLTNADGARVAGKFGADKHSWTSTEVLGFGKAYKYAAVGTNTDGKPVQLTGSFRTVSPDRTIRATVNPIDNAVVGVGMPISVKFASPPADRAAAERALTVHTSPTAVEGGWAWIKPNQVDWRPKNYWPAHTKVRLSAKLYGVHYGDGAYGRADITSEFTIGRNQVVRIHTPDHVLKVLRDGRQVASYPSSNGRDADPNLNTPNGTLVVMTREPVGDFSNPRYGYTNVKKKWSVRISNHGEYIHENEENAANIGKRNTSHGCVNLRETDAKKYFDSALIGDPVEITGSKANMPKTSDVFDWLIPWRTWQTMSALR